MHRLLADLQFGFYQGLAAALTEVNAAPYQNVSYLPQERNLNNQPPRPITATSPSVTHLLTITAAVFLLPGCAAHPPGTLAGTATYRERIALPPGAVFEAVLRNESQADAAVNVLGRATLNPAGQPPFHFQITYDKAAVQSGRYAVSATVKDQERLLFTTNRSYPVLDGNNAPLKMALVSAGAKRPTGITDLPASYEHQMPGANNLIMNGMFTYQADAATITLCADGRRLPVTMEADYKALEKAYIAARPQPGQALLVNLEGTIAQRPALEESQPPHPTLVVERFMNISPRETCGQPLADSPLRGTYWKLTRLNGEPVEVTVKRQEPHLIFAENEPRVSGSSGCNRVLGGYEVDGDKLRLGQMAGTMMACLTGMDLEQRFLQTLAKVARYRINGSHLEMLDSAGTMLARFEAVVLR